MSTLRVFSSKYDCQILFPKECYMWLMKLLFNKCLLSLFSQVIVYFLITKRWACDLLQPYERNTRVEISSMHPCSLILICPPGILCERAFTPLSAGHFPIWTRLMMQTQRNRRYKWDSGIRLSWTTDWCSQLTDFNKIPPSHSWLIDLWLYCKPELKKNYNTAV